MKTNHKSRKMFWNILSIVVMLAMAFPATGSVAALEPALPEGWHDGMDGYVNASGCNVFGWTVDSDDRDRDLRVQVLADGNFVIETIANLVREDVDACIDGTCGFGVSLWGVISAGVEHQITVQAYDVETSTWVDLSGTPKSLTCWGYPEGFHDGNEGTVDENGCTASGWAADPDDRDRDLQVQVLADGVAVAETTANLLREDVTACTEGTCGYSVGLWDLISLDVEHQIAVQAFDVETNTWMDLEATPKSLTCQTPPPPSPFLVAAIDQNWMWAWGYRPASMVTVSVYETKDSSDPVVVINRLSDASGNVEIQSWEHDWDIEPGNYMVATDGMITDNLVMEDITLDVFDPDNDIISGTTSPNRRVSIGVGGESGEYWMDVVSDPDGVWSGKFSSVFDITPDMWASGNIYDEDGDITAAHNSGPALGPRFVVFPEWEWFDGNDWPDGAVVTISVDNKPECSTEKESWDGFFNGSFGEGCNIETGDKVTFTDGKILRTHIVRRLADVAVDSVTNIVSGKADEGETVYVWPHGTGPEVPVTVDASGIWQVDFTGISNIVEGTNGRSEIRDERGNATAVDWYVPMYDWQQINENGFGDPLNIGTTALEVFQGQLYAGASRGSDGAEVWRLDSNGQWSQVNEPGFGTDLKNSAIIDLGVFQGKLYAGVGWGGESWNDPAGQMWRSPDGKTWEPVTTNGFGNNETISITNFIIYKGIFYAGTGGINETSAQIWRSSTGQPGSWNQVAPDGQGLPGNVTGFADYKGVLYAAIEPAGGTSAPIQVWRSTNGSDWTSVTENGFEDERNVSVGGFAQFGGYLYLGTRNDETGAQLWRTKDGIHWAQVISDGFGDLNNVKIESLLVYDDLLYTVTYNSAIGLQLWRSVDGVNWEQVTANGFGDNGNTATLWNNATVVHKGNLVVGTWNNNEGGEVWMFTP